MPSLHIVSPKKRGSGRSRETRAKATKSGQDAARRSLWPTKPGKPNDRKKAALRRLGVSAMQVKTAPDISTLLKKGSGGLTRALEAMRFSNDPSVIAFLEKYDAVPARDREALSWEAIAIAADVNAVHLLGGVILALQAQSANEVKIIALTHHPEMMAKRVEFGRLAAGERDRTAIDTGLGFLPTAKGATFIINPNSRKSNDDDEGDDEPLDGRAADLDHLFPSLSKTQEALVPLKARQLEAGS